MQNAGYFALVGALIGSFAGATATYFFNRKARRAQTAINVALEFTSDPMVKRVNLFERCCAEVKSKTSSAPSRIGQLESADVGGSSQFERQEAVYHVLRYLEKTGALMSANELDRTVFLALMQMPLREVFNNLGTVLEAEQSKDWLLVLARVAIVKRLVE